MKLFSLDIAFTKHVHILTRSIGIFLTAISLLNIGINFYPIIFTPPDNSFLASIVATYINFRDASFAFFSTLAGYLLFFIKDYPLFELSSVAKDFVTFIMLITTSAVKAESEETLFTKALKKQISLFIQKLTITKHGVRFDKAECRGAKCFLAFALSLLVLLPIFIVAIVAGYLIYLARWIPRFMLLSCTTVLIFSVYPFFLYYIYNNDSLEGLIFRENHKALWLHILASACAATILLLLAHKQFSIVG